MKIAVAKPLYSLHFGRHPQQNILGTLMTLAVYKSDFEAQGENNHKVNQVIRYTRTSFGNTSLVAIQ